MSSLRLLALPAHSWQLHRWELTSGDDLRVVRTGLHHHLEADAGQEDVAERIALVCTELAGNALRHGRPPVVVRLLRDDDCYFMDVSDHDPDHPPLPAAPRPEIRAGGRGLLIARSMAQQLCWYRDESTKHVWASFLAPPARL